MSFIEWLNKKHTIIVTNREELLSSMGFFTLLLLSLSLAKFISMVFYIGIVSSEILFVIGMFLIEKKQYKEDQRKSQSQGCLS